MWLEYVTLGIMIFVGIVIFYGFIAAFCAGLALGTRTPEVRHRIQEFGEAEGTQLSLFVFLVFGLVMVPAALEYWRLTEVIYALASLTVIRMIPVAMCLAAPSSAGARSLSSAGSGRVASPRCSTYSWSSGRSAWRETNACCR